MVFEVVQECAICAICLTDAQPLPVPGANENEGKAERGVNAQTRERSRTPPPGKLALAPPAMAWSHRGAMDEPVVQLPRSSAARAALPSPPA